MYLCYLHLDNNCKFQGSESVSGFYILLGYGYQGRGYVLETSQSPRNQLQSWRHDVPVWLSDMRSKDRILVVPEYSSKG